MQAEAKVITVNTDQPVVVENPGGSTRTHINQTLPMRVIVSTGAYAHAPPHR